MDDIALSSSISLGLISAINLAAEPEVSIWNKPQSKPCSIRATVLGSAWGRFQGSILISFFLRSARHSLMIVRLSIERRSNLITIMLSRGLFILRFCVLFCYLRSSDYIIIYLKINVPRSWQFIIPEGSFLLVVEPSERLLSRLGCWLPSAGCPSNSRDFLNFLD